MPTRFLLTCAVLLVAGCARSLLEPQGSTSLGANAVHLASSGPINILAVDCERTDILERAETLLKEHGIGFATSGSLTTGIAVAPTDIAAAARVLRSDPLTDPHVHPMAEHCARMKFYETEKVWVAQLPITLAMYPQGKQVLARVKEILVREQICYSWSPPSSVGWQLGVLSNDERRAKELLEADELVKPILLR